MHKIVSNKEYGQIKTMLNTGLKQAVIARAFKRSSAYISMVARFPTKEAMLDYNQERSKARWLKNHPKQENVFKAPSAPEIPVGKPILPSDKMIALLSEVVNELVLIRKTVSNGKTVIEKF